MGRIMGQIVHMKSRHLVAFQQFFVQMYVREPSQGLVTPVQLRSSSPDFLTAPLPCEAKYQGGKNPGAFSLCTLCR